MDSNIPAFDSAGLAKVSYIIAPRNIGTTYSLTFDAQRTALTAIAAFDGMPYDVKLSGGSITLAAIPEPASFALVGAVALLVAGCANYLNRRAQIKQRKTKQI